MKPEQMKPTPASFSKEIPREKGCELRRGYEGVIAVFKDRNRSSEFIFWNTSTKELPELVLDGELLMLDANGRPAFDRLARRSRLRKPITIEHAEKPRPPRSRRSICLSSSGRDVRSLLLLERKTLLEHRRRPRWTRGHRSDARGLTSDAAKDPSMPRIAIAKGDRYLGSQQRIEVG